MGWCPKRLGLVTTVTHQICGKREWQSQGSLFLTPSLISMADQPSTAARKSKKKDGGVVKNLFRDLIKRPKLANDLASQANSIQVSTFGAHRVSGNDAERMEPTASSKYIGSILLLSTIGLAYHTDPTAQFHSARLVLSSDPDLPCHGELQIA